MDLQELLFPFLLIYLVSLEFWLLHQVFCYKQRRYKSAESLNVSCEAYVPNTYIHTYVHTYICTYIGMYVFYCHATLPSLDSFLLSTLLSRRTRRFVYWQIVYTMSGGLTTGMLVSCLYVPITHWSNSLPYTLYIHQDIVLQPFIIHASFHIQLMLCPVTLFFQTQFVFKFSICYVFCEPRASVILEFSRSCVLSCASFLSPIRVGYF